MGLVRSHGYSVRGAALEAGLDPSNFNKKLIRQNETIPDAETRHRAAVERILTSAEELSEAAGEKLIDDRENDHLKPGDLVKTSSAATNQVAGAVGAKAWARATIGLETR